MATPASLGLKNTVHMLSHGTRKLWPLGLTSPVSHLYHLSPFSTLVGPTPVPMTVQDTVPSTVPHSPVSHVFMPSLPSQLVNSYLSFKLQLHRGGDFPAFHRVRHRDDGSTHTCLSKETQDPGLQEERVFAAVLAPVSSAAVTSLGIVKS